MTLVHRDRVKETSTTTGTGTYTLAGAVAGFQSFAAIGNANTCYYCAIDGTNWEVGIGTYATAGTTLARTTILASSNADAAVSWSAGTRTIFCDIPASKFLGVGDAGWTQLVTATTMGTGTSKTITDLPSGYQQFVFRFNALDTNDVDPAMTMALSSNNGSSFGTAKTVSAKVGTSAAFYGVVVIDNVGNTGPKTFIPSTMNTSAGTNYTTPATDSATTGVINAIKMALDSGGNYRGSGTFTVWGVK